VPKDRAQDGARRGTFWVATGSYTRDDDALGVDHFTHDTAGAVGGACEDRRKAELFGGYFLEVAEKNIRGGVAACERYAKPADERREKWK